jgi:hypothetical protein
MWTVNPHFAYNKHDAYKERMSKLIDKFNKAAQSSPQPMGFRTNRIAPSEPGMILIAAAGIAEIEKSGRDIDNAGAVLLRLDQAKLGDKATRKIIDSLLKIPWGLYLEDTGEADAAAITDAGVDFIVFPPSGRVWTPPEGSKMGRILEVESSLDDGLIRAANSLPVDAVLITDTFEAGSLFWHQLMIYQHMNNLISRPLIVNAPAGVTGTEIKALSEAGVDGIIVDVSGMKEGRLKELREAIAKMPPRLTGKKGRSSATLRRMGALVESAAPAPDEEDEEEE